MNSPAPSKPLVSIVTGYYNRPENLRESIQSVLDQTYSNFEYIVFDDKSTDETSAILLEFDDPRLTLYRHEVNLGLTKGLIQAIARSKGEFIAIHGAGDISLPTRIEKQVELLTSNSELGVVGCLIEDIHDAETSTYTPTNNRFTHGEVMYRKDLYYQVGGYNPFFTLGQFTHLKSELLKVSKGDYVREIVYRRIHFKNGVTRNAKKRFLQKFLIKSGAEFSKNGNQLISYHKDRLLVETYISLIKEQSDAVSDIFFVNYTGSSLLKFAFQLQRRGFLSKRFLLKALSLTGKYEV